MGVSFVADRKSDGTIDARAERWKRKIVTQLKATMALAHYDRHIPFFDGTVSPEGIDLTVLEVGELLPLRHGTERHGRMLQHAEFDICEVSLSFYLTAKSRGKAFTAIPVFPRRLFSQSPNLHDSPCWTVRNRTKLPILTIQ